MGIVEGVTEFLPISSTGHMILVSKILGIEESEFLKSFEIVVQLGAISAVAIMYVKKVWEKKEWWGKLLVSFIVTGSLGLVFYKAIKEYLIGNVMVVVVSLFLGGIALIFWEKMMAKKGEGGEIDKLSYRAAAGIGLVQVLSVVPGVSRSMATIFGGVGVGLSRKEAVEFSFLLAVPTMIAASMLDLMKSGSELSRGDGQLLLIGLVAAFLSAWVVVKVFVKYVQTHDLSGFGWYRIIVAVFYLMLMRLGA